MRKIRQNSHLFSVFLHFVVVLFAKPIILYIDPGTGMEVRVCTQWVGGVRFLYVS